MVSARKELKDIGCLVGKAIHYVHNAKTKWSIGRAKEAYRYAIKEYSIQALRYRQIRDSYKSRYDEFHIERLTEDLEVRRNKLTQKVANKPTKVLSMTYRAIRARGTRVRNKAAAQRLRGGPASTLDRGSSVDPGGSKSERSNNE